MLDFANAQGIFSIYGVYHHGTEDDQQAEHRLLGRVLIDNGNLLILDDNFGILGKTLQNGPVLGRNMHGLQQFARNTYMDVVSETDVKEGKRIDLIPKMKFGPAMIDGPEAEAMNEKPPFDTVAPAAPEAGAQIPEQPKQSSVFDYMRIGMNKPQVIEIYGNNEFYMNGHKLSQAEVERIEYNVRNGLATLRYRQGV